jgi:hypothetical protein
MMARLVWFAEPTLDHSSSVQWNVPAQHEVTRIRKKLYR